MAKAATAKVTRKRLLWKGTAHQKSDVIACRALLQRGPCVGIYRSAGSCFPFIRMSCSTLKLRFV